MKQDEEEDVGKHMDAVGDPADCAGIADAEDIICAFAVCEVAWTDERAFAG